MHGDRIWIASDLTEDDVIGTPYQIGSTSGEQNDHSRVSYARHSYLIGPVEPYQGEPRKTLSSVGFMNRLMVALVIIVTFLWIITG